MGFKAAPESAEIECDLRRLERAGDSLSAPGSLSAPAEGAPGSVTFPDFWDGMFQDSGTPAPEAALSCPTRAASPFPWS